MTMKILDARGIRAASKKLQSKVIDILKEPKFAAQRGRQGARHSAR
jgi:hypothetical protein